MLALEIRYALPQAIDSVGRAMLTSRKLRPWHL
jgi:hypothetical protein